MENENFFEVLLKNYKGDYMLRKNLLIFEQIKYQISKKYTKKNRYEFSDYGKYLFVTNFEKFSNSGEFHFDIKFENNIDTFEFVQNIKGIEDLITLSNKNLLDDFIWLSYRRKVYKRGLT
jgi:hypothetical protein